MGEIVAAIGTCHTPYMFTRPPDEDPNQLEQAGRGMNELGKVLDETKPDAILFFGAELTKAYAQAHGSRIVPDEDARPVTAEARAQQGLPTRGASQPRPLADGPHLLPPSRVPTPSPVVVPRREPGPESGTSTGGGIPWGGLAVAAGVAALLYLRFRGEDEDEGDGDDDGEA